MLYLTIPNPNNGDVKTLKKQQLNERPNSNYRQAHNISITVNKNIHGICCMSRMQWI